METANLFKIFLVDDDSFSRNIYRQHLINIGYENISEFENGLDCLNNLDQAPKVIFLDHGMDYLTGLDVLKKIRKVDKSVLVVFLSGQSTISTAVKALRLGAVDYIVKGINDFDSITKVMDKISASERTTRKTKTTTTSKRLFALI